jgi:hypothetical protein
MASIRRTTNHGRKRSRNSTKDGKISHAPGRAINTVKMTIIPK